MRIEVDGLVVWARQIQIESSVQDWHELAVRLLSPTTPEYRRLVLEVDAPDPERRAFPRYPHVMRVWFSIGDQEAETDSVDASQGGLFLVTDDPPTIGQSVNLRFQLPGDTVPVEMSARVVRRISADQRPRSRAGFAVQFKDLSQGEEQIFVRYLGLLRELHGALAAPTPIRDS